MNLKFFVFVLIFSFSAFSLACGSSQAAFENRAEIVFDDGYKNKSDSVVVIDDRNLNSKIPQVSTTAQNSGEMSSTLEDLSEITTKYDRYGNKIETRYFKNHPRLDFVLIETTPDSRKQIYVYGRGTDVKSLPVEMTDRALTASSDEIANAAGLYETGSATEIKNFRKPSKPVQPLPSSSFPLRTPQNIQQPEAEKQNTEQQVEENSSNPPDGEKEEPLT